MFPAHSVPLHIDKTLVIHSTQSFFCDTLCLLCTAPLIMGPFVRLCSWLLRGKQKLCQLSHRGKFGNLTAILSQLVHSASQARLVGFNHHPSQAQLRDAQDSCQEANYLHGTRDMCCKTCWARSWRSTSQLLCCFPDFFFLGGGSVVARQPSALCSDCVKFPSDAAVIAGFGLHLSPSQSSASSICSC